MKTELVNKAMHVQSEIDFDGTVLVEANETILLNQSFGYANRSDKLENNETTRFGIASGGKLFTAVAICQLVEEGLLSFDSKLNDCLDTEFEHFDENVTIHHLLTHTSGIPDYFDEEVVGDFENLWRHNPMYQIRHLHDFLPLFEHGTMKQDVGERFQYNNAAYILLGLIIEQTSGMSFSEYVQMNIFDKADMKHSGYFSLDALPSNTAFGYIECPDGTWKTNIYSIPVKGGSDGGVFVTAPDMINFWKALLQYRLLNIATTTKLLTPHVKVNESGCYGYGVWIRHDENQNIFKYHIMGCDPGVNFHSAYYPEKAITAVVCSNQSDGAYDMISEIEDVFNKA